MTSLIFTTSPPCDCGSLYLPSGSKYDSKGLTIRLYYIKNNIEHYIDLPLVHNQDIYLTNEEVFVTTSEKIDLNQDININRFIVYCAGRREQITTTSSTTSTSTTTTTLAPIFINVCDFEILNRIKIIIKSYNSKQILALKNIGTVDRKISLDSNLLQDKCCIDIGDCYIEDEPVNLYNDRLQIEVYSICDKFDSTCCDRNPDDISLSNVVSSLSLPCCSTTSTTTSTTSTITSTTTTAPPQYMTVYNCTSNCAGTLMLQNEYINQSCSSSYPNFDNLFDCQRWCSGNCFGNGCVWESLFFGPSWEWVSRSDCSNELYLICENSMQVLCGDYFYCEYPTESASSNQGLTITLPCQYRPLDD